MLVVVSAEEVVLRAFQTESNNSTTVLAVAIGERECEGPSVPKVE
jgi:hypothetical protein